MFNHVYVQLMRVWDLVAHSRATPHILWVTTAALILWGVTK